MMYWTSIIITVLRIRLVLTRDLEKPREDDGMSIQVSICNVAGKLHEAIQAQCMPQKYFAQLPS
jgi:hypothetical protein